MNVEMNVQPQYVIELLPEERIRDWVPALWQRYSAENPLTLNKEYWMIDALTCDWYLMHDTTLHQVVGCVFFSSIIPEQCADGHIAFWGDIERAEKLQFTRLACDAEMHAYELCRINAWIPFPSTLLVNFAKDAGFQMIARVPHGFRYEGKLRDFFFMIYTGEQ